MHALGDQLATRSRARDLEYRKRDSISHGAIIVIIIVIIVITIIVVMFPFLLFM